ncbi:MAG: 4Fe-4S ferredoxin [Desulfovibrio sp.]|nr:MAG: 4Fe-4S ferredoxin [Desulfovibrio sp.]
MNSLDPSALLNDPLAALRDCIAAFLATDLENTLGLQPHEPAWEEFLVGAARGDDPLFLSLKTAVGPFHWTPAEFFALYFPELSAEPQEIAVISWVLPQRGPVRMDHRKAVNRPSERWSRSRHYGELCNKALRTHVAKSLTRTGFPAASPWDSPQWKRFLNTPRGLASSWSERHNAFVCGLGTFGLSDGLITEKGKAVRLGSVVARLPVPQAKRPYGDDFHAYCLHYSHGSCSACMKRCPKGAISENGHDKNACQAFIAEVTRPFVKNRQLGFEVSSCGLCQVGVPCEEGIPVPGKAERPE